MTSKSTQRKRARSSISINTDIKRSKPDEVSDPLPYVVDALHDGIGLLTPIEDLSPLTSPEPEVEQEDDEMERRSIWCRRPENNWLLDGETLDSLKGPEWKDTNPPLNQVPFTQSVKFAVRRVVGRIVTDWPTAKKETTSTALGFATPYAFYVQHFRDALAKEVNNEINSSTKKTDAIDLHELLTRDGDNVLKQQLLDNFGAIVAQRSDALSQRLHNHFKEGKKIAKQLKNARITGKQCREKALWIGVEREDEKQVNSWLKKYMVESDEQAKEGLKSGAFTKDEYIRVDQRMHRLCAPPFDESNKAPCHPFILWTKESPTDNHPRWDKVFGGIVHGLHALDPKFSDDNEDVAEEMLSVAHALEKGSGNPLKRPRLAQGGVMVKAAGPHTTYHIPYEVEPSIPKRSESKNMRKSMQSKLAATKQLRLQMRRALPILQARSHAFLSGFLPVFAELDSRAANQTPEATKNILGYPNLSSFGTFAYCASSHLDKDDSATSGFVMKRSDNIKRNESNFVWTSHGLIVELNNLSFWYWNAPKDSHGTTVNSVALANPTNYQHHIKAKDADEVAQWTRVFVMPHTVGQAHVRAHLKT